jgi:Icc protein
VAASGWAPDVIAMTGDIVQDDGRRAYERLRELMAPLGRPVHCVPGNHDRPALMRETLDGEPFRYCAVEEHGGWLVAGIDTSIEGAVGGRVEEAELERLREALDRTAAEHAVVCLHHPPLPVGSRWLDQSGLENGREFLETVAASGKVRLVLFGHVHQAFESRFGPVKIVGTPSTCSQFEPHSSEYAVSDAPPAYRRITLEAAGGVRDELVWVDADAPADG